MALTPGEGKLDLLRYYDILTVEHLFERYGEQGRTLYAWDLVIDMLYPASLSLSAILFTLLVIRHPLWQKLLILFPLVFLTMDVIENIFFLFFLWTYLSSGLVTVANIITRIKLFTIYITFLEFYLFAIVLFVFKKLTILRLAASRK